MWQLHTISLAFPTEIVTHIFRLGCEDQPETIYGSDMTPRSQRRKHPFLAVVSTVCRLWYEIANQSSNDLFFFTYLDLHLDLMDPVSYDAFIVSFTEYRRGLLLSKGSRLFIRWRINSSENANNSARQMKSIFLHAIYLILDHQDQSRTINASQLQFIEKMAVLFNDIQLLPVSLYAMFAI